MWCQIMQADSNRWIREKERERERHLKQEKEGKEEYKLEDITLGGMECKKSGLSGKF